MLRPNASWLSYFLVSFKHFPIEDIVSSNSFPRFPVLRRLGGKALLSAEAGVDDLRPSSLDGRCRSLL